jgi:hypothetical protein
VKLDEKATTEIHAGYWNNFGATYSNTTHTISVDLKAGEVTKARVAYGAAALTSGCYVDVDLATGTALGTGVYGTGTYTSNVIEALPLGGYRVKLTGKMATGATLAFGVVHCLRSAGTPSYLGTANEGIYVLAWQTEATAYATSPIINASLVAAVTRPADVPSYTGALCGQITSLATSFWRPVGVATAGAIASLSDGTANEYESIGLTSATAVQFTGVDGGASQWATTASNAYTAGTQAKVAQAATTNSVLMDLNGTAQTPDTSATMPTYTALQLGHLNGASQINGAVGPTYGWTRLLSQSELAAVDR